MKHFFLKSIFVALVVLLSHALTFAQNSCTLDPAWVSDGMMTADYGYEGTRMLLLPDGRLVVASNNLYQGQAQVKCFNPDGSVDTNFGTGGSLLMNVGQSITEIYSVTYLNGTLYFGGTADSMGAWQDYYAFLAATTVDGDFVTSFGGNGVLKFHTGDHDFEHIHCMTNDDNGDLYIAGVQWYDTLFVAKLTSSGQMVTSWGTNGFTKVGAPDPDRLWKARDIEIDKDKKVVLTGKFAGNFNNNLPYFQHLLVARFNTNGSLDYTFANNGIGLYNSSPDIPNEGKVLIIKPNNHYLIVGTFLLDWQYVSSTALQIRNNGSVDPGYGVDGWVVDSLGPTPWTENEIDAQLLPDGHTMIATTHYLWNGFHFGLTMFNADGSVDSSFGTNGDVLTLIDADNHCYPRSMVFDIPQGKIYASGYTQLCTNVCGPVYMGITRHNYTFAPPLVGVNDAASQSLTAFPNPVISGGLVSLSGVDLSSIQTLELMDISGKSLQKVVSSGEMQLPDLSQGIYCLRITTASSVTTQKLVVR